MDRWQIGFYGTAKAYQARWEKAQSERTPLCADLVESEVLWGANLKRLFEKIFELERKLFASISVYLDFIDPDTDERARVAANKIRLKNRDVMYAGGKDKYRREFEQAVEDIEKYLKPKLIQ